MSDITNAIKQICEEKNLSYKAVLETIESALAAAYRKDFGEKNQNVKVEFDPETAKSKIFDVKTVVEDLPEIEELESTDVSASSRPVDEKAEEGKVESQKLEARSKKENKDASADSASSAQENDVKKKIETSPTPPLEGGQEEEVRKFNPKTELQIKDAKLIKKSAKIGDIIKTKLKAPAGYGRMAAQTAKQVIIQKLREAEREMIFSEFKNKEHEVVAGVIQRREGRVILVDLGKAVGVLPAEEQIMSERYRLGDRLKVYVKYVGITPRGPEIILSRTSEEILKKVFYLEIPEIANGLVEIKAVAREAGNRSKVAVFAAGKNVDPIGSCVGQRGSRIQTIISELGGEKIDIIEYNEESAKFIAQALAPAKVLSVELHNEEKKAVAKVVEDQLSLAIGREGQNVRLAAKLTGWKLDIVGERGAGAKIKEAPKAGVGEETKAEAKEAEPEVKPEEASAEAETGAKSEIEVELEAEAGITPLNPPLSGGTNKAEKAAEATPEAGAEKIEKTEAAPAESKTEPAAEKQKKKKKSKKSAQGACLPARQGSASGGKEKKAKEAEPKVETENKIDEEKKKE